MSLVVAITALLGCSGRCEHHTDSFTLESASVGVEHVEATIGRDVPPYELSDTECRMVCEWALGQPVESTSSCEVEFIVPDTGGAEASEGLISCAGTSALLCL